MKHIIFGAAMEALPIVLVAFAVALVVNFVRKDGLPMVAAEDAFRVKTKAEFITPDDAWKVFQGGSALFVDARDPGLFGLEHIEGALNVAPSQAGVDSLAWMAPADPDVIAYASKATQRQAGVLADKLMEAGFKKVHVLLDGIEAWKAKGLPIEGRAD
ncbi:MAG TPA: rhodanese-like domain-containing protein [bacterium]|nr:rhodanese-like domain-containing protein [bacterium]